MYDYDKQLINIDFNLTSDNKYGVSFKFIQVQKKNINDNSNIFLFKD